MFNPRFGGSFKDKHTSSLAALMNLSTTSDSTSKKYGGVQPGQSILTGDLHMEAHKYVWICIHSSIMNIYPTCTSLINHANLTGGFSAFTNDFLLFPQKLRSML